VNHDLQGKVALVTGSGRGIGRAIALKLASAGASVVVNDLDDVPAQAVVRDILELGGRAVACSGNVTAPEFADRFISSATSSFQGLDIIVNNAGYTWDSVIQKMTDAQWHAMIDCHLTAPFRILRAAYPVLRDLCTADRAAGRRSVRKVVNISSIAGLFGNAGQVNYATAKAGILGMTQTLAKEWGRLDVTVNAVAYGLIQTRLTAGGGVGETLDVDGQSIRVGVDSTLRERLERSLPLGRGGTPEEAAGAVYALCIPEADYISGQTLMCSGGLTGI
jgi:3-oxoacyl-[acyl-carrier protein] reductase